MRRRGVICARGYVPEPLVASPSTTAPPLLCPGAPRELGALALVARGAYEVDQREGRTVSGHGDVRLVDHRAGLQVRGRAGAHAAVLVVGRAIVGGAIVRRVVARRVVRGVRGVVGARVVLRGDHAIEAVVATDEVVLGAALDVRRVVDRAGDRAALEQLHRERRAVERGDPAAVLRAVARAVAVGVGIDRVVARRVLICVVEAVAIGVLDPVGAAVVVRVGLQRVGALAQLVAVVDAVAIRILVRVAHAVSIGVREPRVRVRDELAHVRQAVAVGVRGAGLLRQRDAEVPFPAVRDAVVVAIAAACERGRREREQDERGGDDREGASGHLSCLLGVLGANLGASGRMTAFRRIHPEPGTLSAEEAAAAFGPIASAPPERPYLGLNMVATADGKVTIDGRSGPIGNAADRELFHELRGQVDAVMSGAGTVRTERYGRIVRDPERRERRVARGLEPDPIAVIVSGRLDLPTEVPLFQAPEQRVVVITGSDGEVGECPADVHYIRVPGGGFVELGPALTELRKLFGIESVLCEGGPLLNSALLREGLVDELWLALAPKLAAGGGPTIVTRAAPDPPAQLGLEWGLESGGDHPFPRYPTPGPLLRQKAHGYPPPDAEDSLHLGGGCLPGGMRAPVPVARDVARRPSGRPAHARPEDLRGKGRAGPRAADRRDPRQLLQEDPEEQARAGVARRDRAVAARPLLALLHARREQAVQQVRERPAVVQRDRYARGRGQARPGDPGGVPRRPGRARRHPQERRDRGGGREVDRGRAVEALDREGARARRH